MGKTKNAPKSPQQATGAPERLPAIGQGKRGESGHLGYLLRQAAAGLRLQLDRGLADLAVTPPQFVVMTMIGAYPGLSNADLARLSVLTPQTVSVIVANLLRADIVIRHQHAIHGRIQQLELTDAGKMLLAQCRDRVAVVERRLTTGLSSADEEVVRRWLVAVAVIGEGDVQPAV